MADRWAEVRDLENQVAAKIMEFYRNWWRPWRQPRLKREAQALTEAMMRKAAETAPRRR